MELAILDLSIKFVVRLHTAIEKTMERCREFYMKMIATHNICQASTTMQIQEYPDKEQHLKNLQDKCQGDEQSIQKVESINEEFIRTWVAQASMHKYLLDEWLI